MRLCGLAECLTSLSSDHCNHILPDKLTRAFTAQNTIFELCLSSACVVKDSTDLMGCSQGLGNISICKEIRADQPGERYCVAVAPGGPRALMYHG